MINLTDTTLVYSSYIKSNPRITTRMITDRKLDVVAKVSDKRKAKVRTTSTSKIIIVNPTV